MTDNATPTTDVSGETWTLKYYRVDGWPCQQLRVGEAEITMIRGTHDPAQLARAQLARLAPEMLRALEAVYPMVAHTEMGATVKQLISEARGGES